MPYIPTESHLPKKDVGKFREWEFCPNTNLQPSTSPPPSSETMPSLATVNDGHHHPQRPSMAHNNPSTPQNDKKDAWVPRQQVNERGRRFALVTARWPLTANDDISRRSSFASMLNEVPRRRRRRRGNQTRNDDIESSFLVVFSFTTDSDGEGVRRRRGTTKTARNDNTAHRQHQTTMTWRNVAGNGEGQRRRRGSTTTADPSPLPTNGHPPLTATSAHHHTLPPPIHGDEGPSPPPTNGDVSPPLHPTNGDDSPPPPPLHQRRRQPSTTPRQRSRRPSATPH
ncbi:hypothetical protein K443DRAFT_12990 [Laccaria amethystina LaAM-08-1]|uniref:Uncharacterized protein n=1 Tax=Laccaria amethystina LaAM-08-1 TaxID=1095629 RepID=A0A0C9X6I8_9AGAR|nr:hypothetical protein K443DRAFT_12990 [Laccaria amethystina LaAM-08-1]